MTSRPSKLVGLAAEFRRRRLFTTAGLYVVGAWLVMQAADVFFPGWGIPDTGINVLLKAAIVGLPLALVFGWFFDVTTHGIRRTVAAGPGGESESRPLLGNDFLILGALVVLAGIIIAWTTTEILALRKVEPPLAVQDAPPAVVEKEPNSVAVLPFDNISTDPENDVFSDGVSEEVRNRLGHYGELHVMARTSSVQFKDSDYAISKISDLLGVRYLVKGSVRAHGSRIRVSAQLLAEDGTQLWNENYDRILEDVFAIQDEIADLVAADVAPQVVANLRGSFEPSLDAYKHYVAGREQLYKRDTLLAREQFALAIEKDPGYAEAYAEYAITLLLGHPGGDAFRKADDAIRMALRLAPELPRALVARGLFLNTQPPHDPLAAEELLRRALQGDPGMVDAMNWLGIALERQGRYEEQNQWLEKAYALDPFNGIIASNVSFKVRERGDFERAEWILRRLVDLPHPSLAAIQTLTEFYTDTGQLVKANRTAKRVLLAADWLPFWLANNYAMMGQFQTAADLVAGTVREYPEETWVRSGWLQAMVPAWRGDYDQAVETTRKTRDAYGISAAELPRFARFSDGSILALAGDYPEAIDTLTELMPDSFDERLGAEPYQALARAYSLSGMADKARQTLEPVEQRFLQRRASVEFLGSGELYAAALNAVLMGDEKLALDRLEQAVEAGWRGYYTQNHDPRWAALKDNSRFQALMAEVKADVDSQWAEVEKIDTEEDFQALLEEIRKSAKTN